jgi:hypothetical protein
MPEIQVKISQGLKEVSHGNIEVSSNTLPDLISALKTAKEETNTILTKLVESSKNQKQSRKTTNDDDEDDSGS